MYKFNLTLFVALLFSFCTKAQNSPTISSVKFGDLKLLFPIDSVNKYLDNKITLTQLKGENTSVSDTVYTTYKGFTVRLVINSYLDYMSTKLTTELASIYCDDSKIKTKSGIKIGDNKYDLIKKLEGSYLTINPNPDKRKGYSIVSLYDGTSGFQLIFYFKDNVLYAIECDSQEFFGCSKFIDNPVIFNQMDNC
ncbi:hypothetical protein ACQ33O_10765 [Ferruginibacter sp. SUN002]|uniref:hypothetical protein n=1 Tax=Ferruginibacter sp. SUN002 TaxID=2937789 RepID=UPI003D361A55